MAERTVFGLSQQLARVNTEDIRPIEDAFHSLVSAHGCSHVAPCAVAGDYALTVAAEAIVRAETTERDLAWTRQALPAVEVRIAELTRAARGRWTLFGVLLIIAIAVLLGQLF